MPSNTEDPWFQLLGDLGGVALWELDARSATIRNLGGLDNLIAVSYTHLTLPTIYSV